MPTVMRGNKDAIDQANKNLDGVQEIVKEAQIDNRRTSPGCRDEQYGVLNQETQGGNQEAGCLHSDAPLPGSNQDGENHKITYRWSYKIGGWRRTR